MRVWELRWFGLDGLHLTDRPDPVPGPSEAVVRVRATSLNYRDWMMVAGEYNSRQPLPLIPLSDGAGIVTAVGEGVTRVKPGDRVIAAFSQTWLAGPPTRERVRGTLGGPLDGMLAEQVCLHADGLVHVPAHLSDEEAATLPCAAVTAWSALVEEGRVQPGDTVLLQGTGGVSTFALQFCQILGARAVVTSSSDEKLERARALGAWQTINYTATPDWDKAVRALTGQAGVDHVVEVGGAGTLARSLRAVRVGGTVSVIGVLTGAKSELAVTPVLMQQLRLQGILVGSHDGFERMNRAISQHGLRPVIDRAFGFGEVKEALAYLKTGRHFGKITLRVD